MTMGNEPIMASHFIVGDLLHLLMAVAAGASHSPSELC
jgi:hypothetical protein